MVFQSYAIWPHMTVFDNVAFPLSVSGVRGGELRRRVMEVIEVVGLAGLEGRLAPELSGGQQQRTALARALVGRPRLLLLDEPLSNLDARLREAMRDELRSLQRQLGITAIYVTHDQVEALSLSTRIAVMYRGRIVQEGTPADIYQPPATRFVAAFVGASNFIRGELVAGRNGMVHVHTRIGEIVVPSDSGERIGATSVSPFDPNTSGCGPPMVRLRRPRMHSKASSMKRSTLAKRSTIWLRSRACA